MLFHRSVVKSTNPGYEGASQLFALQKLEALIYPHRRASIHRIASENFAGRYFFPDLFASMIQSMYQQGYLQRKAIRNALLSCCEHLVLNGYQFRGYLIKGDEMWGGPIENPYVAETWNSTQKEYSNPPTTPDTNTLHQELLSLFSDGLSSPASFIFIAGCQNSSMLNYRLKKAALVAASMIRMAEKNKTALPWIFLSGGNDAHATGAKVHYPDESRHMRNLLIMRLQRAGVYVTTSILNRIIVDTKSSNTLENVANFMSHLRGLIRPHGKEKSMNFRIVLASSTFHLLQISDAYEKQLSKFQTTQPKCKFETYLLGTENPGHFFRAYDDLYIKLLFNEVFFRNRTEVLNPPAQRA